MCGRFALHLNASRPPSVCCSVDKILIDLQRNHIRRLPGYDLDVGDWEGEEVFVPRYNVAPRTHVPVLRRRGGPDGGSELILHTMKWGLVPHWSRFEDKSMSTTNARADNLVEGAGMWASLRGSKRCVVPCQGYYEWLSKGKQKLPHYTKRRDENLMLLAGLYDSAVIEGHTLWTFTIVTTDANTDFAWLHDRQPVILSSTRAVIQWLDTSSRTWDKRLTQLVQGYHDSDVPLECYRVPQEVGKVGVESPSFIEPVSMRKDGIQAMFLKHKQGLDQNIPQVGSDTTSVSTKRLHSPASIENEESPVKQIKTEPKQDGSWLQSERKPPSNRSAKKKVL